MKSLDCFVFLFKEKKINILSKVAAKIEFPLLICTSCQHTYLG